MKLRKLECFCVEVLEFHKRLVQSQFIGSKPLLCGSLLNGNQVVGRCVGEAALLPVVLYIIKVHALSILRVVPGTSEYSEYECQVYSGQCTTVPKGRAFQGICERTMLRRCMVVEECAERVLFHILSIVDSTCSRDGNFGSSPPPNPRHTQTHWVTPTLT